MRGKRSSGRISLRDEAALTWYFLHGESRFHRSTHGAIIDRLVRDSMGSARCGVCSGVGILETPEAVKRHQSKYHPTDDERRAVWVWRDTMIMVDPAKLRDSAVKAMLVERRLIAQQPEAHVVGSECRICRGTGWVSRRRLPKQCEACARKVTRITLPDGTEVVEREDREAWKDRRRTCSECLGTGRATPDVQRTCGSHDGGGTEVDGEVLANFATTNRRLRRVGTHRITLELYYGPHGQSWADQPGGRMLALQACTEPAQRLLKRTKRAGDEATGASLEERLAAQIDLQKTSPEPWRRRLLDAAAEEARERYQWAVQAWLGPTCRTREELREDVLETIDATGEAYESWLERNPDMWPIDEQGAA